MTHNGAHPLVFLHTTVRLRIPRSCLSGLLLTVSGPCSTLIMAWGAGWSHHYHCSQTPSSPSLLLLLPPSLSLTTPSVLSSYSAKCLCMSLSLSLAPSLSLITQPTSRCERSLKRDLFKARWVGLDTAPVPLTSWNSWNGSTKASRKPEAYHEPLHPPPTSAI